MIQHSNVTIGLDLGDRQSHVYVIDDRGDCLGCSSVLTTEAALRAIFDRSSCRVVLEVGTHSPWVSRLLRELGHEVLVANPSAMYGSRRRRKRNDRLDAEFLARTGRADPKLLYPIQHRSLTAQQQLEVLRARDILVRTRTKLINHVRGAVTSFGGRLPACDAGAFVRRVNTAIPDALRSALAPLLETLSEVTQRINAMERQVERLVAHSPVAQRLSQPVGVGPLTALAYQLLIEDPTRFPRSRDVGAYFGLVPRLDESSNSQPQLRISKAGDPFGRRLLVGAAQYILGPFGPPCDLRRYGEAIALRGGRNAKKRAVVAVARKLAVLLHHLWLSEQPYDPDYRLRRVA
jgi:transposase